MAEAHDDFDNLELPSLTPRGLARHFGPGMMLMMTGIGTSHLLTAPTAGGRFEFALLWCIPIAYVFKYYGFEMAFRFTHATGRSMLDAYGTAWKKWPLWYVLITTLVQCAVGQAGRLIAAAAVLYYFFSEFLGLHLEWGETDLGMPVYGLLLGVISVSVILRGKYAALELVTKICAGLLCVSAVAVYLYQPAPIGSLAHFFHIKPPEESWLRLGHFFAVDTPKGSWLIIASFLGLLPTGIDVSLQASEWGKAKKVGMGRIRGQLEALGAAKRFEPLASAKEDLSVDTSRIPPHALEYCRRWYRISQWDFRLGHVVSFVMACIFLLLAAVWMHPSEVKGRDVMGEIARMFTASVGPGMMIVFLAGAFAATFSTAFNYFDGWPRVVGACCRNLFGATARLPGTARDELTQAHRRTWCSEYNIYRLTMLYSLVAAVIFIAVAQRPVFLVLVASALAYFIAPIIFFLNVYYCVTVIPKSDKLFYPSRLEAGFAWLSLAVFTGLSVILILARVFKVEVFGA